MKGAAASKVFIVGTGRSGTHWLARSLTKSGLSCSLEDHLELVKRAVIYKRAQDPKVWGQLVKTYQNDRRLVDKSHPLLWEVERLAKAFPNAKFIGVVRQREAVVRSMLKLAGVRAWCADYKKLKLPFPNRFLGCQTEEEYGALSLEDRCRRRWQTHTDEIERLAQILPKDRWLTVHYDRFEEQASEIQSFIGCTETIKIIPRLANH